MNLLHPLIAQMPRGLDGDILYSLVVILLMVGSALAEWFRKRAQKRKQEEASGGEEVDYEVVLNEKNEVELRPRSRGAQPPQREVARPARMGQPARPAPMERERPRPGMQPEPFAPKPLEKERPRPEIQPRSMPPPAPRAPAPAPTPQAPPRPRRQERRAARPPAQRPTQPVIPEDYDEHRVFQVPEVKLEKPASAAAVPARGLLAGEQLDRNAMRRAIILAEILSPPLGMRGPGEGPLEMGH